MATFLRRPPKGDFLRNLYTRPLIYGTAPTVLKWSKNGTRLAFLWNDHGEPLLDLYVAGSERLSRVTDAAEIGPLPVEDDERPEEDVAYAEGMACGIAEFDWLGDDLAFLLRGNLFVVSAQGEGLRRVTTGNQVWNGLQAAPDGRRLGFMCSGNVWTYDLPTGALTQVTFFGKEHVSVSSFRWSPDSRFVAVEVEDNSMFEVVRMPDYTPEAGVKVAELRRNNVGKPLSKVRVGIVPSTGGKMARLRFGEPSKPEEGKLDTGDDIRPAGFAWTCDGAKLVVAYTDESYVDYKIVAVEPGGEEKPETLFDMKMEPWAECGEPASTPDSKHICFTSFHDGSRRVYRLPIAGGEPVALSPAGVDVVRAEVPKQGDRVFYTACAPHPTEQQVYAVPIGGGDPVRISDSKTHSDFAVSDDGASVALVADGVMLPPEVFLVKDGKLSPVTRSPLPAFSALRKPRVERMAFVNPSDGRSIHAKLLLPHDFDPNKRYPAVLSCVYAGQGKESFGRYQLLDTYMANEMGYVLVGIDLRASIGYGKDFFFGYRKKLGLIDAEECVSCARHLRTLPYIDPERIGIWGGSYGGFLTLMAMCEHPGEFHTGVAWKPVTDWKNYWDSYTAPRLGRPKDDSEIYKATSPVFHAAGLQGNLLIIHGMQDDNVLFQDAVWMIQKLVEAEKYFDLMIYPRDDHGLTLRHESLPDCMERIAAYFEEHMGVGPV
jgi:dipeptidyl-peptidase-4